MPEDTRSNNPSEKKSEPRTIIDRFFQVEIDLGRPVPIYQFQLRNMSGHGICILVKEDSSILDHLTVGKILKMRYWSAENSATIKYWEAQIKHITGQDQTQLKGHYLVGLYLLKEQSPALKKSKEESLESVKKTKVAKEGSLMRDNSDRRLGADRRKLSNTGYIPERRSGKDRRSGLERRSGLDHRRGIDRRSKRNL
jgi:hypothetical protein